MTWTYIKKFEGTTNFDPQGDLNLAPEAQQRMNDELTRIEIEEANLLLEKYDLAWDGITQIDGLIGGAWEALTSEQLDEVIGEAKEALDEKAGPRIEERIEEYWMNLPTLTVKRDGMSEKISAPWIDEIAKGYAQKFLGYTPKGNLPKNEEDLEAWVRAELRESKGLEEDEALEAEIEIAF